MLLLFICHSTSTITNIQQQYYRVTTTKTRTSTTKEISIYINFSILLFLLLLVYNLVVVAVLFNCNCVATITHAGEQKYEIKKALLTTCFANHILHNRCDLGQKSFPLYIPFPICDYHSCVLNLLPHAITIYLLFVSKRFFFSIVFPLCDYACAFLKVVPWCSNTVNG